MKTILAFFLAAWMVVWPIYGNPLLMLAGSPPVAGQVFLINENCDSTSTPSGWTNTGTVTWGSTNVTLIASGNLLFDQTATKSRYDLGTTYSNVWIYFAFRHSSSSSTSRDVLKFVDSDGSTVSLLLETNSGEVRLTHGGTLATSVQSVTSGTVYRMWIHYVAETSSGANDGYADLYFGTTGTRPSVTLNTTGRTGNPIRYVEFHGEISTNTQRYDNILMSETEIGNQ